MKATLLFLLTIYQLVISPLLHQVLGSHIRCRYAVSCSEYAKNAITLHGAFAGTILAVKRLFSCQPFVKTQSYATL